MKGEYGFSFANLPGEHMPNGTTLVAEGVVSDDRPTGLRLSYILCVSEARGEYIVWERNIGKTPSANGLGDVWCDYTFSGVYFNDLEKAVNFFLDKTRETRKHRLDMKEAKRIGRIDGESAASWLVDGNTKDPVEVLRRLCKGIDDGDPQILDELPRPRLSGEWADDKSWPQVWTEITDNDEQDFPDDGADDLFDIYDSAFQDGVEREIKRMFSVYDLTEQLSA